MKISSLLLVLMLAGCAGGARNDVPVDTYDFGQAERIALEGAATRIGGRIALEVLAAPWLDAPYIDYRLVYEDPLKRRQYSSSRWAAPPASLLAQHLRRQLGVASVNSGVAAGCLLRIELQEFSHVFSMPNDSRGVLQGQVSVIDGKRRMVAGRAVRIETPAATADARGGVAALVVAGTELGRQIFAWLEQPEMANELRACGSAR